MDRDGNDIVEFDTREILQAVIQKIVYVIIACILAGVLTLGYTVLFVKKTYTASTLMYVNNSSLSIGSTSVSISDLTAAQSLVDTYIVILESRSTLNDVIAKAGLEYDYEELKEMISATPVNSTEVFEIVITSTDPAEAEKIANTIAVVLPAKIAEIIDGSSVKIVDYAVVPGGRAAPSYSRNTVIGMCVGLVASIATIVLIKMFDIYIRSEQDLASMFDIPVLSVIPSLQHTSGKGYYGKGYYRRSYKKSYHAYARESQQDTKK